MISGGGPPFELSLSWEDSEPKIDTRMYVGDRPIEPTDGSLTHEGDQRSPYDECGCIAPCPDHKSPRQDAEGDRAYWNDLYSESVATDDQETD